MALIDPGDTPGMPFPCSYLGLTMLWEEKKKKKNLAYYKPETCSDAQICLQTPAKASGIVGRAGEAGRSWGGGEAAALGIINEQRVMGKARIN